MRASFPRYTAPMRFIVPYLFPPGRLRDAALAGVRLPALETLCARGRRQTGAAGGLEAALAELLGVGAQGSAPLAPYLLKAEGMEPGDTWWLRVEAVHLQVRREGLVPMMGAAVAMTAAEAAALHAGLTEHFGAALPLVATPGGDWYWPRTTPLGLDLPPPGAATGRALAPPSIRWMIGWQKLMNEIQMLLHDHPVNRAREAAGQPAINSLWLWGEGRWAPPPLTAAKIYADHPLARQLALGLGLACRPLPGRWDGTPVRSAIVVLDGLLEAGQYGDAWAWRAALQELERDWLAPLLKAGRRCVLHDPQSGTLLHWRPMMAWKFWRRTAPLAVVNPLAEAAAPVPSQDEFGNRF